MAPEKEAVIAPTAAPNIPIAAISSEKLAAATFGISHSMPRLGVRSFTNVSEIQANSVAAIDNATTRVSWPSG
jgi:hypothetical protein